MLHYESCSGKRRRFLGWIQSAFLASQKPSSDNRLGRHVARYDAPTAILRSNDTYRNLTYMVQPGRLGQRKDLLTHTRIVELYTAKYPDRCLAGEKSR